MKDRQEYRAAGPGGRRRRPEVGSGGTGPGVRGGGGPMRRPESGPQRAARTGETPVRPVRGGIGGGHPGMAMPAEKPKDARATLRRLAHYLKPRRLRLVMVLATAVLSTTFAIVSPKILGRATTTLFTGLMMKIRGVPGAAIDFDAIRRILLTLIALYLASAAFGLLQQLIMAGVAQRTTYDMREDVNRKLRRLPLAFFDSRTHGEILSRVTNDVDLVATTLQQSVTQVITAVVSIIGVTVMMLSISRLLTLVVFISLPFSVFIMRPIIKRSQRYFAAQQRTIGNMNGHVEEMYGGHTIVKAFGMEGDSIAEFDRINSELYDAGWKAQFISGIVMPLMRFVNNIAYVLVSVIGAVLVTRGRIAIGDIQAFIQYARQFSQPLVQVANVTNVIQSTIAAAERVFELLDEEEESADPESPVVLKTPRGHVLLERVAFRYLPEIPLITSLSLEAKPGSTIAIVGPTGAGKTTLVNLLMRFYEIDEGRISVDGVSTRDMSREGLRSLFGMVLQDTWLFSGTIRENIAYGRGEVGEREIVAAARLVHADHFIRTLPGGYDTVINEDGSNISQGQKQLLTIARAVLADPAILILDEATSSVDTRTEALVQKAMLKLMAGRTNFVIAHRLSTIRGADLILVMNEGEIIETGTHEQLLDRNGFYADLYNSQFRAAGADAV